MLKIGEFSKLTKTTVKALRYYDDIGLLKPAFTDTTNAYRYYTEEQIAVAQKIQTLKSIGLSCKKIKEIFEYESNTDAILSIHKQELKNQKAEIDFKLKKLDYLMHPEQKNQYNPFLEHIEACTVYYSRSFVKDINHIMDFIKLTLSEFKNSNPDIKFPSPDYCCIIYPDDSYRETNIFVEYVQSVDKKGTDTPVIKFKTLEAITAISVTHYGGYENLHDAYSSAVDYALANGFKICGNARERYLRGAWNCDNRDDWETVVQLPVILK